MLLAVALPNLHDLLIGLIVAMTILSVVGAIILTTDKKG